MHARRLSIESITLSLVGLSLIPRMFTAHAYSVGTISIILFWLPILVIMPTVLDEEKFRITPIKRLSKVTLVVIFFSAVLIFCSIIFQEFLYKPNAGKVMDYMRRSLYLLHPLICLSWFPYLRQEMRSHFLIILSVMILVLGGTQIIPRLFENTLISEMLNGLTAIVSSALLSFLTDVNTTVNNNFFGNSDFLIEVKDECSSIPQIAMSVSVMICFYICCRIKSKIRILKIIILATLIPFLVNTIRISILALMVSYENSNSFDFWHHGLGSLIFSLIIMTICSASYYYHFCKEQN